MAEELGRLPCPLCGQPTGSHDDAACEAKMAAWRPTGLLGGIDRAVKGSAVVKISHEQLCDYTDHQCTPDCPPLWTPPPVPFQRRIRRALRRGWWWVTGLRVVHRSRIADEDDDD